MQLIWLTTTLILFCASSFFSIQLLTELADSRASVIAYTAVAIALALVQYAILPRAIQQWQRKRRISSLTGFSTWLLLTLLSIAASAGALIGDTQRQQTHNLTESTEYQLILSQIRQHQQQIGQLQTTAQIDTENGYRSRATATLDKIPVIQNTINKLRQNLSQLQPDHTSAAIGLFTRLADQTGLKSDTVMTSTYLAVAVLIELALTVSVTALTDRPQTHQPAPVKQTRTEHPIQKPDPDTLWARLQRRLSGGQPVTSYQPV